MTEPEPEGAPLRKRRVRYRGTHPRRFAEKYKEHAAGEHPELVAHVRERGQTPAGQHVPILVEELLAVLAPAPGERGVDCTLGFGGHAERVLARLAPDGTLLALDVDPLELARTGERLRARGHDERALLVRHSNFAALASVLGEIGWPAADFVYADLGVSSMQLDQPERGFGIKEDGPLDMRMNPTRGLPASEWLARLGVEELAALLAEHSDEPHALVLARKLVAEAGRLRTTHALADAVRRALPRLAPDEAERSVRRTFQAVRIAVNRELEVLEAWLRQLPHCLAPGGRVAVLTFHSGEDRRVKHAFQEGLRAGHFAAIAEEVVRPSPAEQRANPRSKPAKLRWARRA